jgi:hypothetical protein
MSQTSTTFWGKATAAFWRFSPAIRRSAPRRRISPLGARFHVDVLPSLAVIRGGATVGVIPRIRDWAEYIAKIDAFLDPAAPPLARDASARVVITYSQKGVGA